MNNHFLSSITFALIITASSTFAQEKRGPERIYHGAVAFRLTGLFNHLDNASGGNPDGKIGRVDVNSLLSQYGNKVYPKGSSNELNLLALRSLFAGDPGRPDCFHSIAGSDDLITRKEMQKSAFSSWYKNVLRENFGSFDNASGGNPDGKIGFVDLEAVINNPSRHTFNVTMAARMLIINKYKWDRLAGSDGLVTGNEL